MPPSTPTTDSTSVRELTEAQKRAFDALETIRAGYYKSYCDTRTVEWKISMSIWIAVAIYASALVIGKDTIEAHGLTWGTGLVAATVILLLFVWLLGTSLANGIAEAQAYETADAMRASLGMEWSPELGNRIKEVSKHTLKNRIQLFRVFHIAALLIFALVVTAISGDISFLCSRVP